MIRCGCVALALLCTLLTGVAGAAGPVMIELQDVPSELKLPAPDNANRIVTIIVRGDTPSEVWIARTAETEHRVTVPAIGEGRYQMNLVDERVVKAMRMTGGSGQFYVFAKTRDGKVAQSAAIRFSGMAPTASFVADMKGAQPTANLSSDPWLAADRVEQLAAHFYPSPADLKVTVTAGNQSWPMERGAGESSTFRLRAIPEVVAAFQQAGTLRIAADSPLFPRAEATARAIPRKIAEAIPDEGLAMTVPFGEEAPVPGTGGFLYFRLTKVDTAGNAAEITLHRRDEGHAPKDPMLNEVTAFRLGDEQYVWVLTEINPDARPEHASVGVRVYRGEAAEQQMLRRFIEYSLPYEGGRVMKFAEKEYRGVEAATQLRRLYESADGRTLAAFGRALRTREDEVKSRAEFRPASGSGEGTPILEIMRLWMRNRGWEPIRDDRGADGPAARVNAPAGRANPEPG